MTTAHRNEYFRKLQEHQRLTPIPNPERTMNTIDPKLTQAMEYVVKAQQIMTVLGHTKYRICGMVSRQMLHDSEQEVSVLLGELHKLTEQRDRLAEALRECCEDSIELLGERDWWEDEPRCGRQKRYQETCDNVTRANKALQSLTPNEL
jgi:hypothetical protein